MTMLQPKALTQNAVLFLMFWLSALTAFAQEKDSAQHLLNFRGSVSVTNNGFSLVPTFTLGKPALVTILSVSGKRRLSFEPEFRYSDEQHRSKGF